MSENIFIYCFGCDNNCGWKMNDYQDEWKLVPSYVIIRDGVTRVDLASRKSVGSHFTVPL